RAPVQHDDVLDQPVDLVDQVGGQDDGARVGEVVREQAVVEGHPRRRVQAQVDLVEDRQRRAARETQDDPDGGALATGELAGLAGRVEAEDLEQFRGEFAGERGPGAGGQVEVDRDRVVDQD